jgi:hypothetical protein
MHNWTSSNLPTARPAIDRTLFTFNLRFPRFELTTPQRQSAIILVGFANSSGFIETGEHYLPSNTDHSEQPNTLPPPELNPLLNPLLGENMNRWAEVYFTSPPERREQAVLELLHELQQRNANQDGVAATSTQDVAPEATLEPASQLSSPSQSLVRCDACGRENPPTHRFCGMCGRPVSAQRSALDRHVIDLEPAERSEASVIEVSPQDAPAPRSFYDETLPVPSQEVVYEPPLNRNELSLFQGSRDGESRFDDADETFGDPPSRPYRVYVGVALAAVIFALAYMAWRGAQSTSQNSRLQPQAPPVVTTEPVVPAAAPPVTTRAAAPDGPLPSAAQPAIPSKSDPESDKARVKAGSQKGDQPSNAEKGRPEVSGRNGAVELAIAQDYLTGANGEPRNSAEAAKWLWKSLAKHNATATLALADLYLKGDGVSKNCDQARVLLDSAARGGIKQAGERLRNLQAFGCQ